MTTESDLLGSYVYPDSLKGVHYGPGSLKTALPMLLATLGVKKAFVVTGHSLHTKTDVVQKVEDVLKARDAYTSTFSEIGQHAPVAGINAGIDVFTNSGADFIVSVGGGSPNQRKQSYHLSYPRTRSQQAVPKADRNSDNVERGGAGAGYTNEAGDKIGVFTEELIPAGIILDAELTLATPERLWLSSGMRAVDHAVESLYRPNVPYPIKVLCYDALSTLYTNLPLSKSNPSSLPICQKLQIAAWMSLWPIKFEAYTALGLSHALGHRLGARYAIPHGITSCLTLAPVIALQASFASPEHKKALARALFYLKIEGTGRDEEDVQILAHAIEKLVEDLGLKTDLKDWNVPRGDVPKIVKGALGGVDETDSKFIKVVKLLENMYPD